MTTPSSGLSRESRLLFAFLPVVLFVVCVSAFPRIFMGSMWPDEALYAWLAERVSLSPQVLFSKEFVERQPPLFPLLLSLAQHVQPFSDAAVRAVPFLINITGIVASFYAGRLIGGSEFIAAVCAIGVGFSLSFFVFLPRILSDGVMMTLFLFFILSLFKALQERSWLPHVLVGSFGISLLLLKWSGSLCLPILLICYLTHPSREIQRRSIIPAAMILVTLTALLWNNLLQLGTLLPNITALQGAIFTGPPWFYIKGFHLICSFPGGAIFVLIGFVLMWKTRHPQRVLITAWFWVTFLSVSSAGEKDFRYAFVFLPPAVLTLGILFEYLIRTFIKTDSLHRLVRLGFCGYFLVFAMTAIVVRVGPGAKGDHAYVGFREAGEFLRSLQGPCVSVLADSERAIRYYSGIQYDDYGGRLAVLPRTMEGVKERLEKTAGTILMVIDAWEYTQPEWAYPFNVKKLEMVEQAGFRLVRIIRKEVSSLRGPDAGLSTQPVIWIFLAQGGTSCQD